MMKRTRALATAAVGAVALSTAAAVAPTATAVTDPGAAAGADWLAGKLVNGIATYPQADYNEAWEVTVKPEYGITIDTYFALKQVGVQSSTQAEIIIALSGHATDYVAGFGSVAPAAAGKLASAVATFGANPKSFGGRNLIGDIEAATDDATGETTGTYGGVGQAWATRGLVWGGSPEATKSVAFLLSKQCPNGSFKQVYTADCTAAVQVDSTAQAIAALNDAKAKGFNVADAIAKAGAALVSAQAADGSFVSGGGNANANSTGLAAWALKLAQKPAAADKAATWISALQVTAANSASTPLSSQVGAVAYDAAALTNGKADGIEDAVTDQWVRASAQAVPGLTARLGATSVKPATSTGFASSGKAFAVTATGLEPGEPFTAAIAGGASVQGTVSADGVASATLTAPVGNAKRIVTVTGAKADRVGTAQVTVVGKKKLSPSAAKSKVKRGKTQRVTVRGLRAGEPVKVYFRGKVVKTGYATKSGTFARTFSVGKKTGKTKVTVRGAFSNRTGSKAFRVVK